MKTFIIECEHNIYVDNYSKGETENVNNFDTKGTYKAEEPAEAIKQHLNSLGYNFKSEFMQLDEEEENQNKIWYSVLCDVENNEATKNQKTEWIKDNLVLYANNMTIYVYEVVTVKI